MLLQWKTKRIIYGSSETFNWYLDVLDIDPAGISLLIIGAPSIYQLNFALKALADGMQWAVHEASWCSLTTENGVHRGVPLRILGLIRSPLYDFSLHILEPVMRRFGITRFETPYTCTVVLPVGDVSLPTVTQERETDGFP